MIFNFCLLVLLFLFHSFSSLLLNVFSFQVPPALAPIDALERYTQLASHPLHKTSKPGIVSLDIHYSKVCYPVSLI